MRTHSPRICIRCGKEYMPTSGPQKFCLNCKPPQCEGCERIELEVARAVQAERKRIAELLAESTDCPLYMAKINCDSFVDCAECILNHISNCAEVQDGKGQ